MHRKRRRIDWKNAAEKSRKANANLLKEALEITDGNKQEAAALLGMSRATFYRMMENIWIGIGY